MIIANGRWGLGVLFAVAGCGASPSSAPATCEPNPELTPQYVSPNGRTMNGVQVNGKMQNGRMANGTTLNGVSLTYISINGKTQNGLQLNGTDLTGVTADGQSLAGADLVGATITGVLSDGSAVDLVITAYALEGGVSYYTLGAGGQPICQANGGRGVFVPGAWDSTGARHDTMTVGGQVVAADYSCTDGAIAKCVVWGYDPARVGADLHQSCTRMVRADYCGTGVSYTKDGTLIDVFDTRGIQQPTAGDPTLLFEAAWTTTGAACVERTRYEAFSASGEAVMPSCWASLPKCASWDEAQKAGAVLGNASQLQSRTFCAGAQAGVAPAAAQCSGSQGGQSTCHPTY